MCGRFTDRFMWRELVELYRITEPYIHPVSNMRLQYNFAPMQCGMVVRFDKERRRESRLSYGGASFRNGRRSKKAALR